MASAGLPPLAALRSAPPTADRSEAALPSHRALFDELQGGGAARGRLASAATRDRSAPRLEGVPRVDLNAHNRADHAKMLAELVPYAPPSLARDFLGASEGARGGGGGRGASRWRATTACGALPEERYRCPNAFSSANSSMNWNASNATTPRPPTTHHE